MKYIKNRYLISLLEKDVTRAIFDNVRNFLYCALFLAMGAQAVVKPSSTLGFYETGVIVSGLILIVISLLLMGLNLLDGMHRLSKTGIHAYVYPLVIFVYFIVTVRIVMFSIGFQLR